MLGNISNIKGGIVEFENMNERTFDAIVFATGYKSTANTWLKVAIVLMLGSFHAIKLLQTTRVSFVF